MADLRNAWKDTGKGIGGAFKGLGKTIINSAKKGADKAVEWAGREDGAQPEAQETPAEETTEAPAEQTVEVPTENVSEE